MNHAGSSIADYRHGPLIGPNDPPPFTVLNEGGSTRCLLVCDHAGLAVPEGLGRLGLEEEDFTKHYAYDVGARHITGRLSETLDAPAILCNYSRLVVDTNRRLDHPTAFPAQGEGKPVPGNANLGEEDRRRRAEAIYEPWHSEIGRLIGNFTARNVTPAFIAIHSFTPVFFSQKRPWEVGALWVHDERIPVPFMEFYRARGFDVGDNQPYDARLLRGSTVNVHADARGLPNVLVEIRHDLIDTEEKGEEWVKSLTECFGVILADEDLYAPYGREVPPHDPEAERNYYQHVTEKARRGEL